MIVMQERYCIDCHTPIWYRHHNCLRCEDCQTRYRQSLNKKSMRRRRTRLIRECGDKDGLGTGNLGPHRCVDFGRERCIICKELRRLGLK